MKPGIYFGLPEADYHAVPALSFSGIKALMISPLEFWHRAPWLNPKAEQRETDSLELGQAYDCRVIEGKARFDDLYAPALDPADYPEALRTIEDLKAALGDKAKGLKTKGELIGRLLGIDPAAEIWDNIKIAHSAEHEGKTLLSPGAYGRVQVAAAMIEKHPDLGRAFSGGYPQVSIFWTDEETDVSMKARLDYLKTRAVVDLKTFGNPFDKPIDRAVTYAMASYKYHIQATLYLEAVERIKALLRDGDAKIDRAAFGVEQARFLEAMCAVQDHTFLFVFQQTGGAPIARGYQFTKGLVYDCAKVVIGEAQEIYRRCVETYGTDPWIDTAPIRAFDDSEFPAFMTD